MDLFRLFFARLFTLDGLFAVDTVPLSEMFPIRPLLGSLICLSIIDFLIARHTKARYFVLHFCLNMAVVAMTWDDVVQTFLYPELSAARGNENRAAMMLVYSIHSYHMLAFKNLSADDWGHHIISVFGVGSVSNVFPLGRSLGSVCFFMCGFPGGIDYLLLALVKHDIISSLTEKRINAKLNLCIRMPGIFFCTFAALGSILRGHGSLHPFWVLLVAFLDNGNAWYYGERVIGNYHVKLAEVEKDKKKK